MCTVKQFFMHQISRVYLQQLIDYRHELFRRVPLLSFVPYAEIKHSHGGTSGEMKLINANSGSVTC
jgi:hypothetical protein